MKKPPSAFQASPPLYGGVGWRGAYVITVVTDCPPETGWTRSEATEGVDGFQFPFLFVFAFSSRA